MTPVGVPLAHPLAAVFDLTGPGHYLRWGVVQISLANLLVLLLVVVVFAVAVAVPFPGHRDGR